MLLLGIDLESTGLDPTGDRIVECGAVLWCTERSMPLMIYSEFVNPERPIPPEITLLTGITDSLVVEFGVGERDALARIAEMMAQADYVVAHFGTLFDKPFLEGAYARMMALPPEVPWIDTAVDVKFAERITTRNLLHLAAEHGFLPGFSHRAVFDVMTMLSILSEYPLDEVIARAKEPMVFLEACVSFDEKEKAKARGYRWYPPQKIWWKAFKKSDSEVERHECGFATKVLPEAPE